VLTKTITTENKSDIIKEMARTCATNTPGITTVGRTLL